MHTFKNRVKIELYLNDIQVSTSYGPEYRNADRIVGQLADVYGIENVALNKGTVSVVLVNKDMIICNSTETEGN